MDNRIKQFLKDLKFNDDEINSLVDICPMLEELDFELASANIAAVAEFGYPADDIGFIIAANPAFLCRTTVDLVDDLGRIAHQYGDVETALKNNPDLI